ncbi:MAG TPA: hypothetical protein VFY22_10380 [Hydrogenophaga sp.]|nr:hypothetical protein [Hydrogenophaga sp.]
MTTIRWGKQPQPQATREVQELTGEHGALARQLASLQDRVSRQIADYGDQVRVLQAEVVRLRGRLLQARTALLWGLARGDLRQGALSVPRRVHRRLSLVSEAMPDAHTVICQTACAGHAHPWLEADGVCRRTGSACEAGVTTDEASIPVSGHHADR